MANNKKMVSWRSESHSDIADTAPFRQHVIATTETAFACALLKELRERGGKAAICELTEEWTGGEAGGRVYEIRAEVTDLP
jgi:hypothetical protein